MLKQTPTHKDTVETTESFNVDSNIIQLPKGTTRKIKAIETATGCENYCTDYYFTLQRNIQEDINYFVRSINREYDVLFQDDKDSIKNILGVEVWE